MPSLIEKLFSGSETKKAARSLFIAIVAQSRLSEYFTVGGLPDTVNGRYEVLALNAFLIMHRLRGETRGAELARAVAEEIVLDFDRNLREMGVGDLSVGRKVKQLTQGFYGRLAAYADGLELGDEALHAALRRNYFGDCTPTPLAIGRITTYLRRESEMLASQSVSALLAGNDEFGPPPEQEAET